jgi:hypothetical protein
MMVPLQWHPLSRAVPLAHRAPPQQVTLHPELPQYATSLVPTAKRQSRTIHGTNTIRPRPDPPTKVKKRRRDEWTCPQHGPMCIPLGAEQQEQDRREWEQPTRSWCDTLILIAAVEEKNTCDLSNTYRTPHQVRCASVLKVPTPLRLLSRQLAPARTRRRQREMDFLRQPTWAETIRSPKYSHPPPRLVISAPLALAMAMAIAMGLRLRRGVGTGIQRKRNWERN